MEAKYIVQHGDSLSSISQALFGAASKWPQLARRNGIHPPYRIFTGQVLQLDNPSGASVASQAVSLGSRLGRVPYSLLPEAH